MPFPYLPPNAPQVHSRWRRWFGVAAMRLSGWKITGNMPDIKKFVLIVAPHTSNWDFIFGALAYFALQLDTIWLVKHTALKGPLGRLAKYFGGAPIDRSRAGDVVQAYVREFESRDKIVVTITPEGTRKKVPEWKRGFYRIAELAEVPIVPVALNFARREIQIMAPFQPTGNYEQDLPKIKAYFDRDMARHPELFG
jgi:1-acyl-sn-glycerol-3-phosphate acyltransferase